MRAKIDDLVEMFHYRDTDNKIYKPVEKNQSNSFPTPLWPSKQKESRKLLYSSWTQSYFVLAGRQSLFDFISIAARTIATLPFIPGHECVGEVPLVMLYLNHCFLSHLSLNKFYYSLIKL